MADRKTDLERIRGKNEPLLKEGYENLKKFESQKQKEIENGEELQRDLMDFLNE